MIDLDKHINIFKNNIGRGFESLYLDILESNRIERENRELMLEIIALLDKNRYERDREIDSKISVLYERLK